MDSVEFRASGRNSYLVERRDSTLFGDCFKENRSRLDDDSEERVVENSAV